MNKRILIVLEALEMGGVSRVSCVIADELVKNNHNVTLYSTLSNTSYYQTNANLHFARNKSSLSNKARKAITKARSIFKIETSPAFTNKTELANLLNYLEQQEFDTVILTARFISYAPDIKRKFPKIKAIGWVHNNALIYLDKYYVRSRSYFIQGLSELDCLIGLTESDVQTFSKYTPNARLIYNPITIEKNDVISNLTAKVISFAGRVDFPHKGIDYLIELASKLPSGWQIKMAGDGNPKEIKRFYALRKKLNAEEKISFEGKMNDTQLQNHYLNSSIYVMTSRWEGMPLVLAEAMSYGLPIVAFEQSGSSEVLAAGKYGVLIENGNIDEIAEAINTLIRDTELRNHYQQLSLQRVHDFELDRIMKRWEEIL
ncbi:glycosyltransferase [Listeria booriae]|uniref:glycosyltransferase n=1 Tax=Listeria booriae TaxID=1552123 RepID=UPI00162AB59C|nr:glycosyltransferase [Listeria booriae]MBC2195821.1 glycosyltransferase family 4 protein [Listeria booriae]